MDLKDQLMIEYFQYQDQVLFNILHLSQRNLLINLSLKMMNRLA